MKEYEEMLKKISYVGLGIIVGVNIIDEIATVDYDICRTSVFIGLGIFIVAHIARKVIEKKNNKNE